MLEDSDIFAIRAEARDIVAVERTWTREAAVHVRPSNRIKVWVRSTVTGPETLSLPDPEVESLLVGLGGRLRVSRDGWIVAATPMHVPPNAAGSDDLFRLLLADDRSAPVVVISCTETTRGPIVDTGRIAKGLVGLAHVLVVPIEVSWALTERLGKKLSCYGGAVRVYLPGFSEDSNPWGGHQLFLADQLATQEGLNDLEASLHEAARTTGRRRVLDGRDILPFSKLREHALEQERKRLAAVGAPQQEQFEAALAECNALKMGLEDAQDTIRWLSSEHAEAEGRAEAAEVQLRAAVDRLQALSAARAEGRATDDAEPDLPTKWSQFSVWCEAALVGHLVLTPKARRMVRSPAYGSVETAARCLQWLAGPYRRARLSGHGGDLRGPIDTPTLTGIVNERCGSDGYQCRWQGRTITIEWHLKTGGNTRAPGRCLRIYYAWDPESRQVVVDWMPTHLTTGAT